MGEHTTKLSEALESLLNASPHLHLGLHQRLFNLTQLARYLAPLLRARLGKAVQPSAITMALSRLQRDLPKSYRPREERFKVENLSVHSNLCVFTVEKTKEAHRQAHFLYNKLARIKSYFTVTEGLTQITLIFDARELPVVERELSVAVVAKHQTAGALSISFPKQYIRTPGFLYIVLQQVAVQGINIIELGSTATELILYLDRKDLRLAFDTIFQRFCS